MPPLKKILVTGAAGQLGSELKDLAAAHPAFEFHFFDRAGFPLQDTAAIYQTIQTISPHYLINCAAYTAVDKAESERELAMQVNALAVGTMAEACASHGIRFIHISTDYVFDGSHRYPLKETDPVAPINFYGETKWRGEELALEKIRETVVIRTSWVYSFYGKNFVKTMIRLMAEKQSVSVVGDQIGSPTYASDLALAILQIVSADNWHPGIYNFSNEGAISWAQFAQEIKAITGSPCQVMPITTKEFPTPAKRPAYAVMDKSKITATYGIRLQPWQLSLKTCIEKLQSV